MDWTKVLKPLGGENFMALLMKGIRIEIAGGDYVNENSGSESIIIPEQAIYLPQPQFRIAQTTFNHQLSITTPIEITSSEVIYPVSFTVDIDDLRQINPLEFTYQVTTHESFDEVYSPFYNLECYVKPIVTKTL